ncbi:unnamed protein product [Symbiodinium pilosum]|uniref:Glycosyl transferase family 25 domain-containing protein n=1 Tax=Symbiodinium pilosum TaxID=2952 RepID=A0A812XT98_SYMPI|nr:unnamed protein product [Symbiodinium pilosum]
MEVSNSELAHQIRRLDAVDGKWLRLLDDAVAEIVDEYALDKARHARRRGAYTIVHNGGRLLHFDNHLTTGGIACAMSHRLALQAVVAHPTAKWGIILEDDIAAMVPRVEEVVSKAVASLPEDWDALFLGYHDDAGRAHPSAYEAAVEDVVEARELQCSCAAAAGALLWLVCVGCAPRSGRGALGRSVSYWGTGWAALSEGWIMRYHLGCCASVAVAFKSSQESRVENWVQKLHSVRKDAGSMVCFSPKSEEAEDSDIQTMATVDDFMGKFQSWQAYYEHVWGLDGMMDEYLLGDAGDFGDMGEYQEAGDWDMDDFLTPFGGGAASPPCDAPPPECHPGDYPDP